MSSRKPSIDAVFLQGQRLHIAGELAAAERFYQQVLAAKPRHADALHALGALSLQQGRPGDADTLISRAIALKPAADFHLTRAHAQLALNQPEDAARSARAVLRARSQSAEAYQVLGHALSDAAKPGEALDAYQTAWRLNSSLPDIRNNLGMALRQSGRLAEAEQALREAPPDPEALVNLSSVQKELGYFAEAEATLRRALATAPSSPVLRYNWSLLMLLLGRASEAWSGWEERFRAGAIPRRYNDLAQWQGEPLAGRTLLVHAEQGLGDVIQFVGYLPSLSKMAAAGPDAARVVFATPARLIRLLASNPDLPPMISDDTKPTGIELVVPLLSIPGRTTLPRVTPPYLFAEAERVSEWRKRIGASGFRVGINWQGFSGRFEDKGRSMPLAMFKPLASVPGVRLISLQKGDGEPQVKDSTFPVEAFDDLDAGADALVDTAAVMECLDLVITSDTSIAHLAGALARPVWVALRRVPDWRWMLDRSDSPWFPTMRLFRQTQEGDWEAVFADIALELHRFAAETGSR